MKKITRTLNIFIFLIVSQVVTSQNTILWKVTDSINNKTSFIVGTFHQFGNSFVDSIPEIKQSLMSSELAVFESIDEDDKATELIESRKESFEIEKSLKKRDLKKLKIIAKDWKTSLYKLRPVEIEWKLIQEFQKHKCKTVKSTDKFDHFDNYLMYIAKKNKIEVLGLENDSLQLSFISKLTKHSNWKKGKKTVKLWINQMATDKPNMNNCNFTEKYRVFDLNYNLETECNEGSLLAQRNNAWMKIIPNLLRNKNTFIAVGYSHLIKRCGIINQLREKGFKVEPIKIKPVANNGYK